MTKEQKCKKCGGLKIICPVGLVNGSVAEECPRCKGTGIEPACADKPEPPCKQCNSWVRDECCSSVPCDMNYSALMPKPEQSSGELRTTYKCYACGEAENTDASCIVKMFAGEPEYCPINGEEGDWILQPQAKPCQPSEFVPKHREFNAKDCTSTVQKMLDGTQKRIIDRLTADNERLEKIIIQAKEAVRLKQADLKAAKEKAEHWETCHTQQVEAYSKLLDDLTTAKEKIAKAYKLLEQAGSLWSVGAYQPCWRKILEAKQALGKKQKATNANAGTPARSIQ